MITDALPIFGNHSLNATAPSLRLPTSADLPFLIVQMNRKVVCVVSLFQNAPSPLPSSAQFLKVSLQSIRPPKPPSWNCCCAVCVCVCVLLCLFRLRRLCVVVIEQITANLPKSRVLQTRPSTRIVISIYD